VLPQAMTIESLWVIAKGAVAHASVAVAIPVLAVLVSAGQFNVTDAGQEITGAMVSWTVINCEQELLFMHASTAVQIRITVYVLPQPGMIESR